MCEGELIREYGAQKVLIHYGGKSAVKSGLLDRVKTVLDDSHISYVELGGVVPNPHLSKVREGIELGKREKIDFILAIASILTIAAAGSETSNSCVITNEIRRDIAS